MKKLHISLCSWITRVSLISVALSLLLAVSVNADSGLLWLVNPDHPLEASYRPQNLIYVNGYPLRPEAAEAFMTMWEDMKAAGIKGLRMQSAYRPYRYQQALFDDKVKNWQGLGHKEEVAQVLAARSVAMPGASEHQTGLAVDVSINGQLNVHFGSTEAGVWLANNAGRYGFITRYPKEKIHITRIIYEPWHLRYVGVPHAQYMQEQNMCMEEYLDFLKEAGTVLFWVDDGSYYKMSFYKQRPEMGVIEAAYDVSSLGFDAGAGFVVTEFKRFLR